jgi:succinate-semialdehyde dehydrogenase/glutarate-semialdehyde dehydrogenase
MALRPQAATPPATNGTGNGAHPAELVSYDPATGAELGRVPIRTGAEVRAAVARARAAQPAWAAQPLAVRLDYLRRIRAVLAEHADELSELTAREMGKHPTEALLGDTLFSLTHLDYVIAMAPRLLRPRRVRHGIVFATRYAQVVLDPRGVIGIISPYNYPVLMTANSLFMALAAGNVVVAKPSEHTPLTVLKLAEICHTAGLPADVFQVLTGDHTTGAALVDSDIDGLVFVGGTAAGRKIAAAAGARLLPVTMELGGNNAMIVLEDADLQMAARAAIWGGFVTSGQVCGRAGRVLVAAPVAGRFLAAVTREAEQVRHATQVAEGVDMGPLTTAVSLAHVRMAVGEALEGGARLVAGSLPLPGSTPGPALYPPTVLADVTPAMRVMREEIFGPVVCVYAVADAAEAVRVANDSPYSLTASVWSRDRRRAWRIARQVRAGSVLINEHLAPALAAESPWGGIGGASGYGRIGGPLGLLSLTNPKYISYDRLPVRRYPWWFPYTPRTHELGRTLVALLYGRTLGIRLAAVRALLADLPGLVRMFRG